MNPLISYINERMRQGFTGSIKIKGLDINGIEIDIQFNVTQGNVSKRLQEIK